MPYSRFLAQAAGIVGGLLVLGYLPTVRVAGEAAIPAMVAGGVLSLIASLAGSVPIWRARNKSPQETLPSMLGSIVLRLAVAIVLAVAVVLCRWFATKPLLIWMAISYVGLLVADVHYARAQLAA